MSGIKKTTPNWRGIYYSKDNCKGLMEYTYVETYKKFPIYKYINGSFKCDTDVFTTTANDIKTVKEEIDKLLCDKKLLLPIGLYTKEAGDLDNEAHSMAKDLVDKWAGRGYNITEIEGIIVKAVETYCCEKRMLHLYNIRSRKYAK